MADVAIDYGTTQSVASALNGAVATIVPQLQSLQSQVNALLSQDGGLWMNATSPALQNAYATFNNSLTQAVNGINNFATQFNGIAGQMQSMDTQMASSITSGS